MSGPLQAKLDLLMQMSGAQLRAEWQRVHACPPPEAFGSDLLARGIAYRLQEKVHGGLRSADAREIAARVRVLATGAAPVATRSSLKPGTRLSRQWHGEPHHVIVLDDGFEYRDTRYSSLSSIARLITGAAWSGPRFFGLNASDRRAGRA